MLDKNKLNANHLKNHCVAPWSRIEVFDEIDSTNNWVKSQAQHPIVCLAEAQTVGRGRNGNQWQSPDAENIYLSFNWLFERQLSHLPLLSLWVGIVVAEAIQDLGLNDHGIKWPNDLYWQHKKLGGILIETSNASTEVIVGIGINTNLSALDGVDQPWTSLSSAVGKTIDRNNFLTSLLDDLHAAMESFQDLSADVLLARWEKWDLIAGKKVSFLQDGETREGVAKGIDSSGYLLVDMGKVGVKAFNTSISKVRW